MFYYLFVCVSVICFENMQLKCLKIKHQMFFMQLIRTIWILQGREVKKSHKGTRHSSCRICKFSCCSVRFLLLFIIPVGSCWKNLLWMCIMESINAFYIHACFVLLFALQNLIEIFDGVLHLPVFYDLARMLLNSLRVPFTHMHAGMIKS